MTGEIILVIYAYSSWSFDGYFLSSSRIRECFHGGSKHFSEGAEQRPRRRQREHPVTVPDFLAVQGPRGALDELTAYDYTTARLLDAPAWMAFWWVIRWGWSSRATSTASA